MRLMWFHLMPYTELPDDFRQKHRSVWVDIHSSLFDPKRAHLMYNDFMDEMEFAADCGFDAVCCNEHHSNGYGLMPSPNLIASALARRTKDTAICVMGNSLALYNPPTRVAEEFAMIDCISGGRLIAGFPVGTPMDTTYCYGQNPSMLRERYLEAHDLVMRAWTEQDTFSFNGRFNQQRYVNIWPRPVQTPHPPVWIPGGGSIETWQWCAEMDYVYAYLSYFGYKDGKETMDGFWREMARLGKDRNPNRAAFLQFVGVAETREKALELYREPAEYFYGRCLFTDPMWPTPPGYVTEATQRAGLTSLAALAESIGFDSVWVIDSQLLCREVTVTLAAILMATKRIRAATGVTQPVTRHASVMASAMATLCELSGGRATMGIGTGFSSLRTIGSPPAKIAEVEAYVAAVRALLRGETLKFGDAEASLSWLNEPAPVPVVIAATGPRMIRTAGRIADGVILHHGVSSDLIARALGWLDGARIEVSCWTPYSLGADAGEARDRIRGRVAGALMNAKPDWFSGAERAAVEALQAGYDVGHHAASAAGHAAVVPDSLVDRYAIAGTAGEVQEQLRRLLDTPGVDRVILNPQIVGPGAKPLDVVLRAFERDVLPGL